MEYIFNNENPNQGSTEGDWSKYFLFDQNGKEVCVLMKDGVNGMEVCFNFDSVNNFPAKSDLEYDENDERIVSLNKFVDDNEEEFWF